MADGSMQGMGWHSASELAGLPGLPSTARRVNARAKREGWQSRRRVARGGGLEYASTSLPECTQAALLIRARRAQSTSAAKMSRKVPSDALWARYERATDKLRDIGKLRMEAVLSVQALMAGGLGKIKARQIVSEQLSREGHTVSAGTIANWQKTVHGYHRGDWLPLLLPHYHGRSNTREIEPAAWDIFKADWLRPEQPSAKSCYRRLERIADARGWELPSLRTMERKIERELPRAVRILARQGEEAMMRTYPAQERDRSVFDALEAVNADGHRWDVMVRFPDGEVGRPVILGWQDVYSGKILGWRLADHESSDVVRLSLADVVRRYGVPAHAWLDNGRAFASKWMTGGVPNRYRFKVREEDPEGLMKALGIEVHWVTPYHGQAKPIERAWRDFCDAIAKHPAFAGAYTGNNPANKPDNYGSRAVAWEEFERVVNEEIVAHNARTGRTAPVCKGRSFDQVFAESYARATVRKVSAGQLNLMLLAAEAVTASRQDGSVRLSGNRYWTEALAPFAGRKVVLRIDPMHLHGSAHVYTLDGDYIAEAPCIASVGFADTNAAREHARGKQQYRRGQKQILEAERRMDAAEVAAQLPTMPQEIRPEPGVVAPVFRHHAKKRAAHPNVHAATGTDDAPLSASDQMITRMSERLKEREI